jgi:hypothetical protein
MPPFFGIQQAQSSNGPGAKSCPWRRMCSKRRTCPFVLHWRVRSCGTVGAGVVQLKWAGGTGDDIARAACRDEIMYFAIVQRGGRCHENSSCDDVVVVGLVQNRSHPMSVFGGDHVSSFRRRRLIIGVSVGPGRPGWVGHWYEPPHKPGPALNPLYSCMATTLLHGTKKNVLSMMGRDGISVDKNKILTNDPSQRMLYNGAKNVLGKRLIDP